ncbi:F-box/LRR-repeat protein fbxl-1-like [Anabrus simplex]|uniref:F-box/LRR-repeat protein fbxl-1-like n=1 Tax=Anabrus simplex TaxID=316456 RepID=UPI0035A2D096
MIANMLPAEVLLEIFSYCSLEDVAMSIPYVCSWWRDVSRDTCLWKHFVYRPLRTVTNKEIIDILRLSPQLKAVDFSKHYIRSDIVDVLIECCPKLERLCVPWDAFCNLNKCKISTALVNLKVLIFTGTELKNSALEYLSNQFPTLEHLEFSDLYFTKNELVAFLGKMQHQLHTLSFRCSSSDGHCILPYVAACKKIKTLCLHNLCDNLTVNLPLEKLPNLKSVTSLTLHISSLIAIRNYMRDFMFSPNLVELQLYVCPIFPNDFFSVTARNCPLLRKLTVHGCSTLLQDRSLGSLECFKKLTSLTICNNPYITNEGIKNLGKVSGLTYLDFYECKKLTVQCFTVICGFTNLRVLKFDLKNSNDVVDLSVGHVKNRSLQFMFYKCTSTVLEYFKKQGMVVRLLTDKSETFGMSVVL